MSTGTRIRAGCRQHNLHSEEKLQEQASHGGMGLGIGKQVGPDRKGIPAASWSKMGMLSGVGCHRTIGLKFLSVVFALAVGYTPNSAWG